MEKMKLVLLPGLSRLILLIVLIFYFTIHSIAQSRSGKVSDAAGKGLAGVTIQVRGSGKATTSDSLGHFRIETGADAILLFSSVGFATREIPVAGKTVLDIVLVNETRNLNEVVVTALGIRKEARRLGYSAATVNTELLTTNRTTNVGNSLEGKVPGLNVSPPASGPGGSSKIRIRGQSSFKGDNTPLIIVDGVPF